MTATETEVRVDDPLRRLTTTFGGVEMAQTWGALYLWELVLNDRPDLVAIVEIGTWQGGFSRYLACQASMRGLDFVTYDQVVPDNPPYDFVRRHVFLEAETTQTELSSWPGPIILLCDGGNKPREAALFGPSLPTGSLLVAHDWLVEFGPEDIPEGFTEVYGDACEALGSMSRIFTNTEEESA